MTRRWAGRQAANEFFPSKRILKSTREGEWGGVEEKRGLPTHNAKCFSTAKRAREDPRRDNGSWRGPRYNGNTKPCTRSSIYISTHIYIYICVWLSSIYIYVCVRCVFKYQPNYRSLTIMPFSIGTGDAEKAFSSKQRLISVIWNYLWSSCYNLNTILIPPIFYFTFRLVPIKSALFQSHTII